MLKALNLPKGAKEELNYPHDLIEKIQNGVPLFDEEEKNNDTEPNEDGEFEEEVVPRGSAGTFERIERRVDFDDEEVRFDRGEVEANGERRRDWNAMIHQFSTYHIYLEILFYYKPITYFLTLFKNLC
jgi:hypothetical protein